MSVGKLRGRAELVTTVKVKDAEGFVHEQEHVLASIHVYREGRHGSKRWANLAAFTEATDLFRLRVIPGIPVTTKTQLRYEGERFTVLSVENIKGRGMYLEVLAKKVEPSHGQL